MHLSRRERILSVILLITLIIGIAMALCISLVLMPPKSDTEQDDPAKKYISSRGQSLIHVNKACNCNIPGLTYRFLEDENSRKKSARARMLLDDKEVSKTRNFVGEDTFYDYDELQSRMDDDDTLNVIKNQVGNDTFYDYEEFAVRNLPQENELVKNRVGEDTFYYADDIETENNIDEMKEKKLKSSALRSDLLMNVTMRASSIMITTSSMRTTITSAIISETSSRKHTLDDEFVRSIWNAINAKKHLELQEPTMIKKRSYPSEAPHCFVPNVKEKDISKVDDDKFQNWKFHSNLISISAPRYLDDLEDRYYLCAGVIIDKQYAITGKNCLRDKEPNFLRIRSESSYWSRKGILHNIVNVFQLSDLAVLKVSPHFNVSYMQILKKSEDISHVDSATSAGWITENREKFSKYTVMKWGKDCVECREAKLQNTANCKDFLGDPLFDNAKLLVGVRACENNFVGISEIRPFFTKINLI